jgi:hypothetical protein
VLVIDCVKGVEAQTEKLMEVCRMRNTPVIVFINKLDLEGRDPFDLLDELEKKLSIKVRPLSWPIGIGATFQGVYDLYDRDLKLFESIKTRVEERSVRIDDLSDPRLDEHAWATTARPTLRHDVELINGGVTIPSTRGLSLGGHRAGVLRQRLQQLRREGGAGRLCAHRTGPRPRVTDRRASSSRTIRTSAASCSRSTRTSIPTTATASPSCAYAAAASSATPITTTCGGHRSCRFATPTTFLAAQKTLVEEA